MTDDERGRSRRQVARAVLRLNGRGERNIADRIPSGYDPQALVRGSQRIVAQDRNARRKKARAHTTRMSRRKNRR